MTWSDFRYLIDNNALSHLTQDQRASAFFRDRCHIPSEVLHEARGFPDFESLKANEYPTTAQVLNVLIEVMATIPVDDTKLVDLYSNRGNADPLLVACAVDAQRRSSEGVLFAPTWVVVSDDKAVQAKAGEFGITVMANSQFAAVLEGRTPPRESTSAKLPHVQSLEARSDTATSQCGGEMPRSVSDHS